MSIGFIMIENKISIVCAFSVYYIGFTMLPLVVFCHALFHSGRKHLLKNLKIIFIFLLIFIVLITLHYPFQVISANYTDLNSYVKLSYSEEILIHETLLLILLLKSTVMLFSYGERCSSYEKKRTQTLLFPYIIIILLLLIDNLYTNLVYGEHGDAFMLIVHGLPLYTITMIYIQKYHRIFEYMNKNEYKEISNTIKSILPPGSMLYIKEKRGSMIYDVVSKLAKEGIKCCIITRINPNRLRDEYNLEGVKSFWLSTASSKEIDIIHPSKINIIHKIVSEYASSKRYSVIAIDGIEYLIHQNDFSAILHLFNALYDLISSSNSILIVSFNPDAMDKKNLARFEREFVEFTMKEMRRMKSV